MHFATVGLRTNIKYRVLFPQNVSSSGTIDLSPGRSSREHELHERNPPRHPLQIYLQSHSATFPSDPPATTTPPLGDVAQVVTRARLCALMWCSIFPVAASETQVLPCVSHATSLAPLLLMAKSRVRRSFFGSARVPRLALTEPGVCGIRSSDAANCSSQISTRLLLRHR
jgi:hypothetical protein